MKKGFNVIPIIQDKSILNIIKYALTNNDIITEDIDHALSTNNITPHTLIILDKDLDDHYIKLILKTIKDKNYHPYIILAISKNYRYFLTEPLNPLISGIIYKPFEIEELFQIIKN